MRSSVRVLLCAATLVVAFAAVASAIAEPVPWARIDVTQHSSENEGVMLVSGELPQSVSLPAEAELAVPAGYELQWVGEILGGPTSQDPALTFIKSATNGIDLYRVTLTKSHIAQIEVVVPEGQTFDGSRHTSVVAWTAPQDSPEVQLNVRIPRAAKIATQAPDAAVVPGAEGYSFYTKTFANVKAGDKLTLAAVYTLSAAAPAAVGGQAAVGASPAIPIVLVLGALAAAAGLIYAVRRKLGARSSDDEEIEAADGEDEGTEPIDAHVGDDGDDEAADEELDESESGAAPSSAMKRNLVTGAIIVVLILAAVLVGGRTTRPRVTGDTISQTFSAGEPCETATIPIASTDDPQQTADRLFTALKALTGLNTATYNLKTGAIEVGFCESQTSAGAVRQVLESTGLVASGARSVSTTTP